MTAAVNFVPYNGYLMGLPTNENHLVFRRIGQGKILFSVTQMGKAASCHFASDKKGLRHLRKACDDFVKFCFFLFPWCKMCIAHVIPKSIGRLIMKIGFLHLGESSQGTVYVRLP